MKWCVSDWDQRKINKLQIIKKEALGFLIAVRHLIEPLHFFQSTNWMDLSIRRDNRDSQNQNRSTKRKDFLSSFARSKNPEPRSGRPGLGFFGLFLCRGRRFRNDNPWSQNSEPRPNRWFLDGDNPRDGDLPPDRNRLLDGDDLSVAFHVDPIA